MPRLAGRGRVASAGVGTTAPGGLRLTRRGKAAAVAALAAPVLAVVLLVGFAVSPTETGGAGAESGATSGRDPDSDGGSTVVPERLALPAKAAPARVPAPLSPEQVSASASGNLVVVPGTDGPTDDGGRVVTYRVLVEEGLTAAGRPVDPESVSSIVHEVLVDPRGWQDVDGIRFVRVDEEPAEVDVVLASPDTVDQRCLPLRTGGQLSCYTGSALMLNARRWFAGSDLFGEDIVTYRQYLIYHEMGHHLGRGHVGCPGPGLPAPVMMQQTKGLGGCVPNAFPTTA